ncbi:hypothetical protein HMPREF9093_01098 [Fusobacterium sp. oral taxon 370 str. F0437]|nr:hypothetical protein HMPREF9093_01098 [Fusobacterium sp. oral taxon 370 str. F0437]
MKQFQENKKAIHPLLIEVGDFLLDIVKFYTVLDFQTVLKVLNFFENFKIKMSSYNNHFYGFMLLIIRGYFINFYLYTYLTVKVVK